jgi:MarR family
MATGIEERLKALGIRKISEWDVLVFLHTHNCALANPDHIGRLLGYAASEVVTALDRLEASGLAERSRLSQGVRLYRSSRPPGPLGPAFDQVMASAAGRAGRLKLVQALRGTPMKSKSKKHGGPGEQSALRWVQVA